MLNSMRIYLKELLKPIDLISDLGIVVQEHAPKSEELAANQANQDAVNPIENEIGKTTDPVRM